MPLFDMPTRQGRQEVKKLLQKTSSVQKAVPKMSKGTSLISKIKTVYEQVQNKLGKYEGDFILVNTEEELDNYISESIKNDIIAIDTETTGLDPITDQIVGLCIYTYNQKAAYVPINHISATTSKRVDKQLSEAQVASYLQRLNVNNTKIIMFNAKFDTRVIRHQLGVYLTPYWCGFIASKCLKNNELEGNLKYLWKKYCSDNKEEEHFTFDKLFEGIKFNLIPINTAYLYAAKDAKMTMDLYDFQRPYLTETEPKCIEADLQKVAKLYREIELPIIPIVADIEDQGVELDCEFGRQLSEKYNERLREAEEAFQQELHNYQDQITSYLSTHPQTKLENPINIASPTQLAELFYDVLQLPSVSRKTPRGTGEDILEKLNHPLGKLVLNYRGIAKLLNTYIDKMPTILNKKTGKIHCSYNQYGTDCVEASTIIQTESGEFSIGQLCEDSIENMHYNIFYNLEIPILNRYNEIEYTSHAIKFKNAPVIRLRFNDGSHITGTYDHPILCDNKFKHLRFISEGDFVDSIEGKNKLCVISKEYFRCDVYDFKVPDTHSFRSNNVISHNTGRFSSSDPNLQNIPSRGQGGEIRKMFIASKQVVESVQDNILNLLIQDEVLTLQGWKNAEELITGDTIICDDGNYTVKNIQVNNKQVLVEIT